MENGNVWRFDEDAVTDQIQESLPEHTEIGNLSEAGPNTEEGE